MSENARRPFQFDDFGRGPSAFSAMRDQTGELSDVFCVGDLERFHSSSRALHLGAAIAVEGLSSALRYERTPRQVARSGVDHYLVHLSLRGETVTETTRRDTHVAVEGDITIYDLAQPNRSLIRPPAGAYAAVLTYLLPRGLLAPLVGAPDELSGQVISGQTPYGRLLGGHMRSLWEEAPRLTLAECEAGTGALASLLGAAVRAPRATAVAPGHVVDLGGDEPQTDAAATLAGIKRHLDRICGPTVNVAALCRTFGMSRASLYRLFEPEGGLVRYVRERNLRRARATLLRPSRGRGHIVDIALAHGFRSESSFIRSFRRAFGVTPGEVRDGEAGARDSARRIRRDGPPGDEALAWIRELSVASAPGPAAVERRG